MSTGIRELTKWNSEASLKTFDNGTGLMVIPSVGLIYPTGNWEEFLPSGNPNYSDLSGDKYFSRVFTGNNNLKFGGIFHFEGLTKNQFISNKMSCLISPDEGNTWYSLKDVRNTKKIFFENDTNFEVTGILTRIIETENGIDVSWAYPETTCSKNPIYFKLGFSYNCPFIIKSISLKSLDGQEVW